MGARAQPPEAVLPPKLLKCMSAAMGRSSGPRTPYSSATPGTLAEGGQHSVSKALEYSAWAVAVSKDGFGYLHFHAIPAGWRSDLHSLWQKNAVNVEELLKKYDPLPEPGSSPEQIMLGPFGVQANDAQIPYF